MTQRLLSSPFALLLSLAAVDGLTAAEPETRPMLRLETGMHGSAIWRIAADDAGRTVLTVADDKTARLWELPTGKLLRVLRVPIHSGNEGKLNACALKPDGKIAVVAGWTGPEWEQSFCVYVFDTASGRMLRRLTGLPARVADLAFSDGGRALAAVLRDGKGLRVWETAEWSDIGRDEDYAGGNSYSVDWHADEWLVTTCYDGALRLYRFTGGKLGQVARERAKSGLRPHNATFSPDGRQIAVGFADSYLVNVLDASNLSFRFAPENLDMKHITFPKAIWSKDGATLAAAATLSVKSEYFIRRWTQGGLGKPKDAPASESLVMDMQPLPKGAILFGAAEAGWGVMTPGGQRTRFNEGPTADYRGLNKRFGVSADGTTVKFSFDRSGREPAIFSIGSRQLVTGAKATAESDLRAPRTIGLEVTGWESTVLPILKRQPLPMLEQEMSRSLAVAEDASFLILGTEWNLRAYSAKGEERWRIPAPAPTWAVNLTDNGRLVIAAYGDGTIRWHRADDGRELLAFFPHADKKRWILWTPEGAFDCSKGSEAFIGWHVNQGKEKEALLHPATKYLEQFHKPDLVQQALK